MTVTVRRRSNRTLLALLLLLIVISIVNFHSSLLFHRNRIDAAFTTAVRSIKNITNIATNSNVYATNIGQSSELRLDHDQIIHITNLSNDSVLPRHVHANKYSIDIISIGSQSAHRWDYTTTQFRTWASHPSRRYFFSATELSDFDTQCASRMSDQDVSDHVAKCHSKFQYDQNKFPLWRNNLTNNFSTVYARLEWLSGFPDPKGWICAQKRFGTTLAKVLMLYQRSNFYWHENIEKNNVTSFESVLPDYLIITDDDTYINLEHVEEYILRQPNILQERTGISQEQSIIPTQQTPIVLAGCRVRFHVHIVNFTFPFGGFGTFFSKASLERLVLPIFCEDVDEDDFIRDSCNRLKPSNALIGESHFFSEGMSLAELLHAYLKNTERFCLHGDWILGYFANFYNISRHVVHGVANWFDNRIDDIAEARLHSFMDGDIYNRKTVPGQCVNDKKCPPNSTICHHINASVIEATHNALEIL